MYVDGMWLYMGLYKHIKIYKNIMGGGNIFLKAKTDFLLKKKINYKKTPNLLKFTEWQKIKASIAVQNQ